MAQATARILDSPALSSGGLENERTTPRATFRRGQLSLQSNEIFGRTNPIPERSRRRANCAQAFVAGPAVFPLYFQRGGLVGAGSGGSGLSILPDGLDAVLEACCSKWCALYISASALGPRTWRSILAV